MTLSWFGLRALGLTPPASRKILTGETDGTASTIGMGTAVGDVVILEDVGGGVAGLPAVDGSQLTGLPGGGSGNLDGGHSDSTYGGVSPVDGGSA